MESFSIHCSNHPLNSASFFSSPLPSPLIFNENIDLWVVGISDISYFNPYNSCTNNNHSIFLTLPNLCVPSFVGNSLINVVRTFPNQDQFVHYYDENEIIYLKIRNNIYNHITIVLLNADGSLFHCDPNTSLAITLKFKKLDTL